MANIKRLDHEKIKAQWVTDENLTLKELAERHGASIPAIYKITKGLKRQRSGLINRAINAEIEQEEVRKEIEKLPAQEAKEIRSVIDDRLRHRELVVKATQKNIVSMAKKINDDTEFDEHAKAQATINDAAKVLGVMPEPAPKTATAAAQATIGDKRVQIILRTEN